jgi:DNA mismatch repair protein MutS2
MRKKQEAGQDWQRENEQRAGLRRRLNEAEDRLGTPEQAPPPPSARPAAPGDEVELIRTGTRATVLSVSKEGVLGLQAGILKITARQDEVRLAEGDSQTQKEARKYIRQSEHKLRALGAAPEIDLRGMTTDEAVGALDLFLGTTPYWAGSIRLPSFTARAPARCAKAVHQRLKGSRCVASFRLGRYGEGEMGLPRGIEVNLCALLAKTLGRRA